MDDSPFDHRPSNKPLHLKPDLDDESFKKILNTVIKSTSKIPEDSETLIYIVLLARNFERAGDRIVNISRQVHQIVTGIDLKASD